MFNFQYSLSNIQYSISMHLHILIVEIHNSIVEIHNALPWPCETKAQTKSAGSFDKGLFRLGLKACFAPGGETNA